MAHLVKPDMPAVLERTHLASSFDAFLLPVYEAGSNSIHALLDRFGVDQVTTQGKLIFSFSIGTTPDEFSVTISDNGIGLDETNYLAFCTPFTGHKLRRGGKGFGRFIAFKVFEDISYYTKYKDKNDVSAIRRFRFDIFADEEILELASGRDPDFLTGCTVNYRQVKAAYHYQWTQLSKQRILDNLTSNFLTYLVDGRMPDTTVIVGAEEFDLRSHFRSVFRLEKSHPFSLQLRETSLDFKCDVARVEKGKPFNRHALLFFADNRLLAGC